MFAFFASELQTSQSQPAPSQSQSSTESSLPSTIPLDDDDGDDERDYADDARSDFGAVNHPIIIDSSSSANDEELERKYDANAMNLSLFPPSVPASQSASQSSLSSTPITSMSTESDRAVLPASQPSSSSAPTTMSTESDPVMLPTAPAPFHIDDALLSQYPTLKRSANTSVVWNYYAVDDKNTPHCMVCCKLNIKTTISRRGANTTNMWHHLKHHHHIDEASAKRKSSQITDDTFVTTTNYDDATPNKRGKRDMQIKLDDAQMPGLIGPKASIDQQRASWLILFEAMIHNHWSMNSIDQIPFQRYVQWISNGRYVPPSRQQLSAMIYGTEKAVREALLPVIAGQNNIAITTDATTHNGRSYLCVTANFISKDWQMIDMCLSVHEVSKRHDHDVISNLLNDCFLMWKHKIDAIVTDGGANFLKAAVEITKSNIGINDSIRCACHGCHNCVTSVLKPLPTRYGSNHQVLWEDIAGKTVLNLIVRCRNIITKIKKSSMSRDVRNEQLKAQCAQLSELLAQDRQSLTVRVVSKQRALLTDNDTRWNSTLNMLRSIDRSRVEINSVLRQHLLSDLVLTEDDDIMIKELIRVLSPVEAVTKLLESGTTPTISLCYGAVYWLVNVFDGTSESTYDIRAITNTHTIAIRDRLLEQFCARFNVKSPLVTVSFSSTLPPLPPRRGRQPPTVEKPTVHNMTVYAMATLLDPRTKLCLTLPATLAQDFKSIFILQYRRQRDALLALNKSSAKAIRPVTPSPLSAAFGSGRSDTSSTPSLDTELDNYFAATTIELHECPLKWWRENEKSYPTIKHLARKYLCIPASTASSERMFSITGILVNKHRNRLSAGSVTHMMFLKKNIKVLQQLNLRYSKDDVKSGISSDPDAEYKLSQ